MSQVTLTDYECEHDLHPAVCAKCGSPATERVPRRVRYLTDDLGWLRIVALSSSLILMPPLFLWLAFRYGRVVWVRIAMCDQHRDHWGWRDCALYWCLLPAWTVVAGALNGLGLIALMVGRDAGWYFAAGMFTLVLTLVVENCVIAFGSVKIMRSEKPAGVKLYGVHSDFVAALAADRARDRVTNPDRRPTGSGVREDYDDEVV
jgi:hypothetical protein